MALLRQVLKKPLHIVHNITFGKQVISIVGSQLSQDSISAMSVLQVIRQLRTMQKPS